MFLWRFFFFFYCTAQHAGSQFPDQELNLCPLQWKRGVLTTEPPGKSILWTLFHKWGNWGSQRKKWQGQPWSPDLPTSQAHDSSLEVSGAPCHRRNGLLGGVKELTNDIPSSHQWLAASASHNAAWPEEQSAIKGEGLKSHFKFQTHSILDYHLWGVASRRSF